MDDLEERTRRALQQMAQMAPPKEPDAPEPAPALPPLPPRQQGPQSLLRFLRLDSDAQLILPLILLLGRDGADSALLLALLYIML